MNRFTRAARSVATAASPIVGQSAEQRDLILSLTLQQMLLQGRGQKTFAGVNVDEATALYNAAVFACVKLLVDVISTLPVHQFRDTADGPSLVPKQASVVVAPSSYLTREEWIGQLAHGAITQGNGYGIATAFGSDGYPTTVEIVPVKKMQVNRVGTYGAPTYKLDQQPFDINSVVHVRGLMAPGDVVGISAIWAARQAIGMGLAAEEYAARYFGDGAHPSTVWASDAKVDDDQARSIKQRLIEVTAGNREPLVIGSGLKPVPMQDSPGEAQLIQVQQWANAQAAKFFGVPIEMIGGSASESGSITYANREQRAIDFVVFCVKPWLTRIEVAWSRLLPRGTYVKFDVESLFLADLDTRWKAHTAAVRIGAKSRDDIRREEKLPPINGEDGNTGAEYLWPPFAIALPNTTEAVEPDADDQNDPANPAPVGGTK